MKNIDLQAARDMVERYKSTRKQVIDKEHKVNDTESTWFPLDKLKEYIQNLPAEATGVRLHLGVHAPGHEDAPHQTSFAMVATVADENGNHVDAIQSDSVDAGGSLGAIVSGKDCPPMCRP
ncbi:hypothetical protein [Mucilaginibacter celer]|uniref:Uncharacterized protein n=1 Tax=Mucilaginibacter celer TaxID=2305508 RepID=A0A494W4A6_9SPHI|nr:hypothetical protein [Mucilaginibacter celer]AYL98378.1 hypothetical protein HYN43_025195 [Mucilaginibacter celer]